MPTRAPALSAVATPSLGSPTTKTSGWPVPRRTVRRTLVPLSFDWDGFFCQFRLHTDVALFLAEFAPKHVAGPRPSLTSPLGGASISGYLNSGRGAKTARE